MCWLFGSSEKLLVRTKLLTHLPIRSQNEFYRVNPLKAKDQFNHLPQIGFVIGETYCKVKNLISFEGENTTCCSDRNC